MNNLIAPCDLRVRLTGPRSGIKTRISPGSVACLRILPEIHGFDNIGETSLRLIITFGNDIECNQYGQVYGPNILAKINPKRRSF